MHVDYFNPIDGGTVEENVRKQVRLLQLLVGILIATVAGLGWRTWTLEAAVHAKILNVERVNIREHDGTIKAVLANSAAFSSEGDRAKQGGVPFSGLMFYNQEGEEGGGLIYDGKATAHGQDAEAGLTFDQYRQDQNIYLHHEEHKNGAELTIDDGLSISSRPDQSGVKAEYAAYGDLEKLPADERKEAKLRLLQAGKISASRVFVGNRRGVKSAVPYDDAGIFIKNRWGRDALKLFVDYDNKPHLEVFDSLGDKVIYDLPVTR